MKRLAVVLLTVVLGIALLCLGATQKLVNQTGAPASGVTLTFSEAVRITSYDKSVFPTQSPASGGSGSFTFGGGSLGNGGQFAVSWKPSNASIAEYRWGFGSSSAQTSPVASGVGTRKSGYRGVNVALELVDKSDLETLACWNANIVRLALNLGGGHRFFLLDPNAPNSVPERDLARLDQFLDQCERVGLRVVIDVHECLGYQYLESGYSQEIWRDRACQDSLVSLWTAIAERCSARGNVIYGYDILNEPHPDNPQPGMLSDWNLLVRRIVAAIREVDRRHAVVVECADWANPSGFDSLALIDDTNVIYSFHMWLPHTFTHQGVNNARRNVAYPTAEWNRQWLEQQLEPVLRFQRDHNVPIIVGEFGAAAWAPPGTRASYLRDCMDLFEKYGFDYCYWSYNECGVWSLEHEGVAGSNSPMTQYVGETEALSAFQAYLTRNVRGAVSTPTRPRCLLDMGSVGEDAWAECNLSYLLWRAERLFEVDVRRGDHLTDLALLGYDVLILDGERESIGAAEIQRMVDFVSNGGGLLVVGNAGRDWPGDLLNRFRIGYDSSPVYSQTYDWDLASYWVTDIAPHPLTENVLALHTNWGGSVVSLDGVGFAVWTPSATWNNVDGNKRRGSAEDAGPFGILVARDFGSGRIVALSDNAFEQTRNYLLAMNALEWIAKLRGSDEPTPSDTATQLLNEHGEITILFDEYHNERNTISPDRAALLNARHPEWVLYRDLLTELVRGDVVLRGTQPLTADALAQVGVLVFAAPDGPLSESERSVVASFVGAGGGLLLLADCNPSPAMDDLASLFGVTFLPGMMLSKSGTCDEWSDVADDVARDHPITQSGLPFETNCATAVELAGTGVTLVRSAADTWLDTDGDGKQDPQERVGPFALAVALEFGEGRVVAVADNAFHDSWLEVPGNRELILRAIDWLASARARP